MESESSSKSPMEFIILQQVQFLELNDHPLFHWELVDLLDAHEHSDSSTSCFASPPINNYPPIIYHPHAPPHQHAFHHDDHDNANRDDPHFADDDDDIDNDDDDDCGYDLNDELVPSEVSNKFWGQRMRKLGKRVSSKMNYSKRSSSSPFFRPGSFRGKHGPRLKHSR